MKQPEFRVTRVSGSSSDWYILERRGIFWGWNPVPYIINDFEFPSIEACEEKLKVILRRRKPPVLVREYITDRPWGLVVLHEENS